MRQTPNTIFQVKKKIQSIFKKKKKKIKCPTRSLRLDFHPEPLPRGLEQASSVSGRGQVLDSDAIVIPGGERTFVEDAGRSLAAAVVGVERSSDEDRRLDSISWKDLDNKQSNWRKKLVSDL
jgi:hypothetical protein